MNIDEYYKNPKTGLKGITKLYKDLKSQGYKLKDVKKQLENENVYQLHKESKPSYQRIIIDEPFEHYQIDLIDMSNYAKENKINKVEYSWILTMIDIFSKQAFAKALKNKSEDIVLVGLKSLIDDNKLDPLVIQSDNGPEFVNNKMKKYLLEHDIFQTVTQPYNPQSNGGIERFNRTLKSMIFKYFSLHDTYRWVDVLDDLLYNYNHSYQSTIQMKPIDVTEKNKNDVLLNIEKSLFNPKIKNDVQLKVGDIVRIKLPKDKLQKKLVKNSQLNYTQLEM